MAGDVTGWALQLHGGISLTWEHDLHLFLRRAKTDAVLYGDATMHRPPDRAGRPRARRRLTAPSAPGSSPVDVTDFVDTEQVLAEAVDELGALHVVVTPAGGGIAAKTLGKDGSHDRQVFRDVLDLNTVAASARWPIPRRRRPSPGRG